MTLVIVCTCKKPTFSLKTIGYYTIVDYFIKAYMNTFKMKTLNAKMSRLSSRKENVMNR